MTAAELLGMTTLTLRVGAAATVLLLGPAVALGYFLARHEFRGKAVLQGAIALPMVVPPVAVGLLLLIGLGPRGPLAPLWSLLDVEIVFTWWAAVIAAAVVGSPLLVRACEQAFSEVDVRYERVGRSLGLGPLRTFFRVTLPLARRGVLYGSILAFTRALGEFGATALVAGIMPGRTETLSLGIWSRVQSGDERDALILCIASFFLALAAMWIAEGWLRRGRR